MGLRRGETFSHKREDKKAGYRMRFAVRETGQIMAVAAGNITPKDFQFFCDEAVLRYYQQK